MSHNGMAQNHDCYAVTYSLYLTKAMIYLPWYVKLATLANKGQNTYSRNVYQQKLESCRRSHACEPCLAWLDIVSETEETTPKKGV